MDFYNAKDDGFKGMEKGRLMKEAKPKKIDVVEEMDRQEHNEIMDEYFPREEAKS
jgi:hypothetical protein